MLSMIKRAAASVSNAATGKLRLFPDSTSGMWYYKDESGVSGPLVNGVTAFNTRTGAVTPQSSDYSSFFYTQTASDARYYTQTQSDARYYTQTQSDARYYTQTTSDARYDATGAAGTAQTNAIAASLQKTANLSDLTNVPNARTALGLGTAATQASTAFDASGAATTAQSNAIAASLQKTSNLSDLTNVPNARTALGLGTAALSSTSAFDAAGAATTAQANAIAASQPVNTDLTAISTMGDTQSFGRSLLQQATAAALTALINLATSALKGLMSPAQFIKLTGYYDAQADFGFVGDLVSVFDGSASTGSPGVINTAGAANFSTFGKIGQRITLNGAGVSGAVYVGTITGINSSTQVAVTPNISTTVSGVSLQFGTDNTAAQAALVAAINGATFPGAKVKFGASVTNAYGLPVPMTFNQTVQFEGLGGGYNADTGDYTRIGGTRLAWWGTSQDGGTAFRPVIQVFPTGVQALKRVAFRSIWIDCRNGDMNQGAIALKLASCAGFIIDDFFIMDPGAIGLWTDIASSPTEAKDCTRFSVRDMGVRALDSPGTSQTTPLTTTSALTLSTSGQSMALSAAGTMTPSGYLWVMSSIGQPVLCNYTGGGGSTTLTGVTTAVENTVNALATVSGSNVVQAVPSNACAMYLNGGTAANSCCGVMSMLQISHGTTWGPAAIEHGNSDSVITEQCMINGGNNTNDGAINRIRKPGVRLNGSNTNATLASRNSVFRDGDAGAGGISQMGLLNTGARLAFMAQPNYWDLYQLGNGAPIPTVEGGSYFEWTANGGFRLDTAAPVFVGSQAISAATATLLNGTLLAVPPQGFQAGLTLRFRAVLTGGAAGVAANTINIRCGTAGTAADAVIAAFTTAIGTAAASEASIEILLSFPAAGSASTSPIAECIIINSAAAGFVNVTVSVLAGTITAFNATVANLFLSASLTTGASKTATLKMGLVEVVKAANP